MTIQLEGNPSVSLTVTVEPESKVCRGGLFRYGESDIAFLRGCASVLSCVDSYALEDPLTELLGAYLYQSSWECFTPYGGAFLDLMARDGCLYFDLVHRDDEVRGWVQSNLESYFSTYETPAVHPFSYCGVPYMLDNEGTLVDPESFIDVVDRMAGLVFPALVVIEGFHPFTATYASSFLDVARRRNLHILFVTTTDNNLTNNN